MKRKTKFELWAVAFAAAAACVVAGYAMAEFQPAGGQCLSGLSSR
jgi:hypothetical protein